MSKLKRLAAPKFWPIAVKKKKYVIKPSPGPHSLEASMPLGMVIRDVLKHADNLKEARGILQKGLVKVNGKVRKSYRFPAGFMDILEIGDETYRMLARKNGLYLKQIDSKEKFKLARIENKVSVGKGRFQLNLHDGTNILAGNDYKTGDVLVLDAQGKIKSAIIFEPDSTAMVAKGKNMGSVVKIKKIIVTKSSHPNIVVVNINGQDVPVPKDYVFVVGKEKPVISV